MSTTNDNRAAVSKFFVIQGIANGCSIICARGGWFGGAKGGKLLVFFEFFGIFTNFLGNFRVFYEFFWAYLRF